MKPDLSLSFDVGHSSLGWAVLRLPATPGQLPEILGTGVVTFGADDCLAVKRRRYRQQRRHVRATRQRIARMSRLLAHLGVLSEQELQDRHRQAGGDSFAWRRAAEILAAAREGRTPPDTGWPELWDILRWYAHNRGYFAPPWAKRGEDEEEEPAEADPKRPKKQPTVAELLKKGGEISPKEMTVMGLGLMHGEHPEAKFKAETMAETIAAYTEWYDREAARWQQGLRKDKPAHFKGLKAAFPREEVVWPEVRALLTALKGRLPKLDDALIRTLLGSEPDPMRDPEAWRTVPCPGLVLPKRYMGGLLFGQMIPRFDNRIIGVCPIQFARLEATHLAEGLESEEARHRAEKESKLPAKATPEFLRYRWAMQLANVFGAAPGEVKTRPLTAEERRQLTRMAKQAGALAKGEFKKAVRSLTGWPDKAPRDNLDSLLLHPDADRALELNPVQNELRKSDLAAAFAKLPERFAKRLHGRLARGKTATPGEVRGWLEAADQAAFDAEIQRVIEAANTRKGKKQAAVTRDELLAEKLTAKFPSGRAPYARPILREAHEEVMKGWDPRAEKNERQPRGCLCQTDELKEAQLHRRLEEQTNNHLIRHRLLILERLLGDLIAAPEFANGDAGRVATLAIEVNRDLRDMSGKSRKEQEQDLGRRLGDFKHVAAKVEEACRRRGIPVTTGLIRKARVAEDLGWRCPYTGKDFSFDTILDGVMDKDHIIPHADRQSDSLDSLVITWNEVNKWKGKRTAMQFIRDEGGKPVPGRPELTILPLALYQKLVDGLDRRRGHPDDIARKKRRIRRLLTEQFEDKEFTPRDLTVTSHLVRLGAQVLKRAFLNLPKKRRPPEPVSLSGSVTGEVRKAWRLLGCLAAANPQVLDAAGNVKTKQDIRGITHLHHALDACVLGLAAHFFPRHGTLWTAMIKRRPSPEEAALLIATGLYDGPDANGRMLLRDLSPELKEQVRQRLAERRVVQHVPADMSGVKIEENTRRVLHVREDGRVDLRQRAPRDAKTGVRPKFKDTDEAPAKLLGLNPPGGDGKLKRQQGVRVITDNFGVAILDHAPEGEEKFVVIPWHRVWHRLEELKPRNAGRPARVLQNGMLIRVPRGTHRGVWRIFSAKNNADGLALSLGRPDAIGCDKAKQNVRLGVLMRDGLEALVTHLAGTVA
jgi:CRISPR-associated endonuclease Csn1